MSVNLLMLLSYIGTFKMETRNKQTIEDKEQSPAQNLSKKENLEVFASPDRLITNTKKISGKSNLKGKCYKSF